MSETIRPARPGLAPLLSRFDAVAEGRRFLAARNLRAFCSADLCLALCERSFSRRSSDPQAALRDAESAIGIADHLACRSRSPRIFDLKARAYSEHGNTLRIHTDFAGSAGAFELASQALAQGTGSLALRAHVLKLRSSLLRALGKYGEAGRLLDEAIRIFATTDPNERVGAMIGRAIICGCEDQPGRAVELLAAAIRLLEPGGDSLYEVTAFYALAWHLADAGRPEDSLSVLHRAMEVFVEQDGPHLHLRLSWLRGHILAATSLVGAAEDELVRARDGFLAQNRGYQAALICLELGCLHARARQVEKLRRCLAETFGLFKALRVPQESAAAVLLLEAARRENEAEMLLREALRRLEARGPAGLDQATSFRF